MSVVADGEVVNLDDMASSFSEEQLGELVAEEGTRWYDTLLHFTEVCCTNLHLARGRNAFQHQNVFPRFLLHFYTSVVCVWGGGRE